MRKIMAISFITIDGVIQSPGSPEEDTSNGFSYGGWVAPYNQDLDGELMQRLMQPSDLLLGRNTFEIWENYWPENATNWPGINEVTKYVLSTTRYETNWKNSTFFKKVSAINHLKNSEGSDLKVWGSSKLIHSLLENNLVDEFWLIICPLTLGKGKKLFTDVLIPASFELEENFITPKGVIIANYKQKGDVKTGTIGT